MGAAQNETSPRVVLSPRGRQNSAALLAKFPQLVTVAEDNQAVVDAADTLIIGVLPQQMREALEPLSLHDDHVVISALAGVSLDDVRAVVNPSVPLIRAIPMPPVRNRASVTVITPHHPAAAAVFDALGGTLPVEDEAALSIFSAITGSVAGHLHYIDVVCGWAAEQGIPRADAETFLRGLFAALAPAIQDGERTISQVVQDHETTSGLNEQLRREFFDERGTRALETALDRLLARVT